MFLFIISPKGFFPSDDTNRLVGITQAQEGISFDDMKRHQLAAMNIADNDRNIDAYMSSVGGFLSSNQGVLFIRLVPRANRALDADKVIQELRPKFAQIPGLRVFLQNPPPISFGATISQSQYQFTLQAAETDKLYRVAQQMTERMQRLKGLQDVTSDLLIRNPQVNIEIDRDKAASLGISAARIETALAGAYSSGQISTIYAPNNEYWVILELLPRNQFDPANLSSLYIHSSGGQLVPLERVGARYPGHRSGSGESSRAITLGNDFIQSGAGHGNRHSGKRGPEPGPRGDSGRHIHKFPGHRLAGC